MMSVAFQNVELDAGDCDTEGTLIFRKGALVAVASKLGSMHGELAGSWYVEATFHPQMALPRDPFPDLAALDSWISAALD